MTLRGVALRGEAWHCGALRGSARQGVARRGGAGPGQAGRGEDIPVMVCGWVRLPTPDFAVARPGRAGRGAARQGFSRQAISNRR